MIAALQQAVTRIAELGGPVVLLLAALSVLVCAVVLYKLWQFAAARVGSHRALKLAVAAWDAGERGAARRDAWRGRPNGVRHGSRSES